MAEGFGPVFRCPCCLPGLCSALIYVSHGPFRYPWSAIHPTRRGETARVFDDSGVQTLTMSHRHQEHKGSGIRGR